MFGWFSPQPPLGTYEKAWAEARLGLLARKLGMERLRRSPMILPTDEFFPEHYQGQPEDVQILYRRVAQYMGVSVESLPLEIVDDRKLPGAAGMYLRSEGRKKSLILVSEAQLGDPERLIATIAHELSHAVLLGQHIIEPETTPDHEALTDLLTIFLGFGIFTANSTVRESTTTWWHMMSRQGYLSSRIIGYACALVALMREDIPAPWEKWLRIDARSAFRAGLKYVQRTGDCMFHPETFRVHDYRLTSTDALERLQHKSATVRLATLWEIEAQSLGGPEILNAVIQRLDDRDGFVVAQAIYWLAAQGAVARVAVPTLRHLMLVSRSSAARSGAAYALGIIANPDDAVILDLCAALQDPVLEVYQSVAWALARFGQPIDNRAITSIMLNLESALIECYEGVARISLHALRACTNDPEQIIRERMPCGDEELIQHALILLEDHPDDPLPPTPFDFSEVEPPPQPPRDNDLLLGG